MIMGGRVNQPVTNMSEIPWTLRGESNNGGCWIITCKPAVDFRFNFPNIMHDRVSSNIAVAGKWGPRIESMYGSY